MVESRAPPGLPCCRHTIWTGEAPVAPLQGGVQLKPRIRQHIPMTTILLLTLSNIFMTFAWSPRAAVQGHRHQLAYRLCGVLFPSTRQPHRLLRVHDGAVEDHSGGHHLTVFSVFSVLYLRESLKWNYLVGFAMMIGAVAVIFKKW